VGAAVSGGSWWAGGLRYSRSMSRIHVREFVVPESAMDVNRHVNNLEYLRWMQDVAIEHSAARGWDMPRYLAEGVVWVVRSHSIEYLRPAFAGDRLQLATWVADLRPRSSRRRYLFRRPADGQIIARAETLWVMVNATSGRACTLPAALRESFEVVADDGEVMARLGAPLPGGTPAAETRDA
jgi:acyl-CoA thioester hydrolase